MGIFDLIFGNSNKKEEVAELLAAGSKIIDVRTKGEFAGGHVAGSLNYPLQSLGNNIKELKKLKGPLVLCCASGNRSGQAERMLSAKGIECINGGSWRSVNGLLK